MSSSQQFAVPPSAALPAAISSAPSADGRIRVLCPKGIDPKTAWPAGAQPLMAYIVYAPLALSTSSSRTL